MLILLSPAKKLDFEVSLAKTRYSRPRLLPQAKKVMQVLRRHSPMQLRRLLGVSGRLAELNYERHQKWQAQPEDASPAVAVFQGDAYKNLRAWEWDADTLKWAQVHLRILSGLYGLLRPLDLIQAHRLEMGSRLQVTKDDLLRDFWRQTISALLNKDLKAQKQKEPFVINLASAEYFSAVDTKQIAARIITTQFVKRKGGGITSPGFAVKRARGAMARYLILNRINCIEGARRFDGQGYQFDPQLSSNNKWVFVC